MDTTGAATSAFTRDGGPRPATAPDPVPEGRKPDTQPGDGPPNQPQSLYAKQKKIYPRAIGGTFRRLKTVSLWLLLGIYFVTPWLRWERPGDTPDQAILLDIDGRRAYILGVEFWPQEVYYLTGLLILAAIGLFFSTALFGRVWCGFACFQTVFTDLFVMVERWLEGDRNRRIKLDKGPWTAAKVGRKSAKHAIWGLISLATAYTFVIYFNDAFVITGELFDGTAGPWVYASVVFLTFTTYLFAGMAREQVCIYMCPYSRFQAAMLDEHSMIVTYEEWRGEPRGPLKKGGGADETKGDCVDCSLCVQVCPTGVDIRKGQQLACIGCALCVDACNTVMTKLGRPGELITYDSIANQVARSQGRKTELSFMRARTLIYSAAMLAVIAVMAVSMVTRDRMEINVLRDRAPLYVTLSDGSIRNGYTFKILNMEPEPKTYELTLAGIEGARLSAIGLAESPVRRVELPVKADSVGSFRVLVTAETQALSGKSTGLDFMVKDMETGEVVPHESVFAGPGR